MKPGSGSGRHAASMRLALRVLAAALLLGPLAARADESALGWDLDHTAPGLGGPTGLLRTQTAAVGPPLSVRVGVHILGAQQSSLLVSGGNGFPGDDDRLIQGTLSVALTLPDLPVARHLELFLSSTTRYNRNQRTDPLRTDGVDEVAYANLALGLKGAVALGAGFSVGGSAMLRTGAGIQAGVPDPNTAGAAFDLLVSWQARRVLRWLPLALHVNAGYLADRAAAGYPAGQCMSSVGNDPCIRSRLVEQFAFDVGSDRFRFALAVEMPWVIRVGRGFLGISPFAEFQLAYAVGGGDTVIGDALNAQADQDALACPGPLDPTCSQSVASFKARIAHPTAASVDLGVRVRPYSGLSLDFAVEVPVDKYGWQYGPVQPALQFIGGLSWNFLRQVR